MRGHSGSVPFQRGYIQFYTDLFETLQWLLSLSEDGHAVLGLSEHDVLKAALCNQSSLGIGSSVI